MSARSPPPLPALFQFAPSLFTGEPSKEAMAPMGWVTSVPAKEGKLCLRE